MIRLSVAVWFGEIDVGSVIEVLTFGAVNFLY
jgi:hypothetical protein